MASNQLDALLRGAGQGASAGWNDELAAKLLAAIPADDGTGIPREYAGGQYEQYRDSNRADNEESQRKFPLNYGAGQLAGAIPSAVATGAGVPAAVGLGAVQGAGLSSDNGQGLVKDAVAGGALGGAMGSAVKLGAAAAPAAKAAIQKLYQGGPPQMQMAPAMGTSAARPAPVRAAVPERPMINMHESGGGRVSDIPMPRQSVPPASLEAAEMEARAALNRAEGQQANRAQRFDSKPLDHVPSEIPEHELLETDVTRFRHANGEEADANIFRRKAKQNTAESTAKTGRPPKGRAR